jgi:hypothetical protein
VVSPDTEFAPVGDKIKIKYREDFNEYKKILIVGKNSDSIQALFTSEKLMVWLLLVI